MKHLIVGRAQAGAEESDDEASSVDHVQVGWQRRRNDLLEGDEEKLIS